MKMKLFLVLLIFTSSKTGAFDDEASITGLYNGPYFDPLVETNLTAHVNNQAVLPCVVRQLGDKSVSWVRMRDKDILTVDRYTFVGDERFEVTYSTSQETWNLVIKYVQQRDAGLYECQVSTEPKMSLLFNLRVVVPQVAITPPEDRYVKAGSTVHIACQITEVVELPDYIFWHHEGLRVLDTTEPNVKVKVERSGPESLTSTLTIFRVEARDNGNYSCMPSNLDGASVLLHVLNEKNPAAMQDGRNTSPNRVLNLNLLCLLVLLVIFNATTSPKLPGNSRKVPSTTMKDDNQENCSTPHVSSREDNCVVSRAAESTEPRALESLLKSYFRAVQKTYFLVQAGGRGAAHDDNQVENDSFSWDEGRVRFQVTSEDGTIKMAADSLAGNESKAAKPLLLPLLVSPQDPSAAVCSGQKSTMHDEDMERCIFR